ncbi:hypothetical protein G9A89_004070 [Geosiphon pyriformis]|nr:hypothetical protein G9A89_004070 [Geosiphon pyriformis]
MSEHSKKSSESETSSFPKGWFYIKSQSCDNVLEPQSLSLNPGVRIVIAKQRVGFDSDIQLWSFEDGFLINKASRLVLDIENGYVRTLRRTHACQTEKKTSPIDSKTQTWVALPDGFIGSVEHSGRVLDIRGDSQKEGAQIIIHQKKDKDNMNQRWIFEPAIVAESLALPSPLHGYVGALGDEKTNYLEFVRHAHYQIYEQKRVAHLSQELMAAGAAFVAIKTLDEKYEKAANNFDYKETLALFASEEAKRLFIRMGQSGNLDQVQKLSISYAQEAYKEQHNL